MVMASQNTAANSKSRLAQMQMRFQQKRQEERDQQQQHRSTELTSYGSQDMLDEATAITTTRTTRTSTFEATSKVGDARNGKVRQMFDERRRGAGIDRGNPLRPIAQTGATGFQRSNTMAATTTTTRQHQMTNGNARPRQVDAVTKKFSSLSLRERSNPHELNDRNNNHNGPSGLTKTRLNPVVTRKSPVVTQTRVGTKPLSSPPPTQPAKSVAANKNRLTAGNFAPLSPDPVKSANTRNPILTKSQQNMNSIAPKKTPMSSRPTLNSGEQPAATSKCRFCGRTFNNDRLGKHEKVCQKTMATKRKIFDASKQRVKGTESEKYQKKKPTGGAASGNVSRSASRYSSAAQVYGLSTGVKKNNWRKKHEDFIKTIRAAKQMQDHLNKGGKLSDLPPPPPSENPDYVQCPYCLRRFNQQAAERHIPLCANMIHNKPKPGAKAGGRTSMKR